MSRENNQAAGKTWVWTYDDAGNILSRKEYAYTTGSLGAVLSTVNYTYDTTWGDLLTDWNGKNFSYDTIGNLTSDGTWSYTWEHGRELASMSGGGTTWNFTYNADGLRTKRSNDSTTYSYVYNGSSLSQMTVGGNTLYFAYDASGTPLSVTYNGTNYYYATNLQGDVTAILNTGGTAVVQYTYDAWGNILTTTGSMASTFGTHNPLRYRGYVYDTDTCLYYLQSRYYNPGTGRFINADALVATGQGLLGNNMFAYCLNNPILLSDINGAASYIAFGDELNVFSDPTDDVTTGGGYSEYIIAIGCTAILKDIFASSLADGLAKKLAKSIAVSQNKQYKTQKENHHIVPQKSHFTILPNMILEDLVPGGVQSPRNIIAVDTRVHRHLHTLEYYAIINISIIGAYIQGENRAERQRNVEYMLTFLGGLILAYEEFVLGSGG